MIDDNGQPLYEVERILAQQSRGRSVRYLVLWKGYPYTEATWEEGKNLEGATDALKTFRELHRTAEHKKNTRGRSRRGASVVPPADRLVGIELNPGPKGANNSARDALLRERTQRMLNRENMRLPACRATSRHNNV